MHPCLPGPLRQSLQRFGFFFNGQPQQLHGRVGINLFVRGTGAARRRGVTGRSASGEAKRGALAEQSWRVLTGLETAAEALATISRIQCSTCRGACRGAFQNSTCNYPSCEGHGVRSEVGHSKALPLRERVVALRTGPEALAQTRATM